MRCAFPRFRQDCRWRRHFARGPADRRLAEILPPQVRVRIIADRGFGNRKLYRLLTEL
jgi:hypothetical protein